jgi:Na+/H+ antiporter NhaC
VVVLELLVKEITEELEHILLILILVAAAVVLVVLVEMEPVEAMVVLEGLENNHLLTEQQLIMLAGAVDLQETLHLEQVV